MPLPLLTIQSNGLGLYEFTDQARALAKGNGQLALGTWQGIYLFERRSAPHRREVVAQLT